MKLQDIIDRENLELDAKKLSRYQREIKETFQKNYDERLEQYVSENKLTSAEHRILNKYNEFLKDNA